MHTSVLRHASLLLGLLLAGITMAEPDVPPLVGAPAPKTPLLGLRATHPRLMLTDEAMTAMRASIANDPEAQRYLRELKTRAATMLEAPPVTRVFEANCLLNTSRVVLDRVTTLALLYRLEGDKALARRAIAEMKAAAAFEDWNPANFLDVAEMTTALALGYDWLYDAMTARERRTIRTAIVAKGLDPGLAQYANKAWWARNPYNWNLVCNSGLIIGALAIGDADPGRAARVMTAALASAPTGLSTFGPDGAWPEGPSYWEYAIRYTLLAANCLRSALGTDCGIMAQPGLRRAALFTYGLIGPTGVSFNFGDAMPNTLNRTLVLGLAKWYDDPGYAYLARTGFTTVPTTAFDLIWFDGRGGADDAKELPRDLRFPRVGVATLRARWGDPKALFVALKAGDNAVGHSHLDLGSFALESGKVRWAVDLGHDDYTLPGYFGKERYGYYRLSTSGHNTLTLDGKNQDAKAVAPMETLVTADDHAAAIADLTAAYAPAATHARRGVALIGGRTRAVVRDEITLAAPAALAWTMHTRAKVTLAPDGRRAKLEQDGQTLWARLLTPADARFAVEEIVLAKPQKPTDARRLCIRLAAPAGDTRITVVFEPDAVKDDAPVTELGTWGR